MAESSARTTATGTASDWLRPRLGVTWATGRVVGVTPRAGYVLIDGTRAGVLAVEGPTAVGLPDGLVLVDDGVLARMVVGQQVVLDRRGATGDGWHVAVRRWQRSRPVPGPADQATVRARLRALGASDELPQPARWPTPDDHLVAGAAGLVAVAAGRSGPRVARALVDDLLGHGPGSTPAGDDLLAAFLATVTVLAPLWGHEATVARLSPLAVDLRARAAGTTTALSATLLDAAIDGAMARPAGAVLAALTATEPVAVGRPGRSRHPSSSARRLEQLARVGHTSGRDLALGIVAAALHLTDPTPRAARHRTDGRSTRSATPTGAGSPGGRAAVHPAGAVAPVDTPSGCTASRMPNGSARARADARS